jgi:hypothetical protein
LKGKPGTVNPPDLTIMTRKQALNNVELIYINSDVPFIASIYLVERTAVAQLIQTMKEKRLMTKEKVLEKCKYTTITFAMFNILTKAIIQYNKLKKKTKL